MKINLSFVFLVFILEHKVANVFIWENRYSELDVYFQGFTFSVLNANLLECYGKCQENILCSAIMMNLKDKTCEMKYATKNRHPRKTFPRHNTIYMETRDDLGPAGSRHDRPIPTCKKLKEDDSQAKSGVYWMKINEPLSPDPFKVFCDMTTDGGGWTLVYSYTFTQYISFNSLSNAVTPMPNWPVDKSIGTWAPQSTETPLSEFSRSAMDFSLWKKIGNEFLVKPNITNWVACVEGTGSLVNYVVGTVTCRVIKTITPTCTAVIPTRIGIHGRCGPGLYRDGHYMNLEGRTNDCWPVHDPCGTTSAANHLTNVPNPGGVVYVR